MGYVRSRCVFEPLKIMVKPGYCSFKRGINFESRHGQNAPPPPPGLNRVKLSTTNLRIVWTTNSLNTRDIASLLMLSIYKATFTRIRFHF